MKKVFLSGKWVLYTLMISSLLFATSCANHTKKESTQQKLEQKLKTVKKSAAVEVKTVKKSAVAEAKQDSVMLQKKLLFFKNYDLNKDNKISEKEYLNMASKKFDQLDTNHDGKLTANETDLVTSMAAPGKNYVTKKEFLAAYSKKFKAMDKNKDGYLTMKELVLKDN